MHGTVWEYAAGNCQVTTKKGREKKKNLLSSMFTYIFIHLCNRIFHAHRPHQNMHGTVQKNAAGNSQVKKKMDEKKFCAQKMHGTVWENAAGNCQVTTQKSGRKKKKMLVPLCLYIHLYIYASKY